MHQNIKGQSSFDRTLYNDRAQGAYFTDLENCNLIKNWFEFPVGQEVCVLEPSIGDGSAVSLVTGKSEGDKKNIKIFGVEINRDRYQTAKNNPNVDYCIEGDFLQGCKITNNSFSFIFANPPYGDSALGERLEKCFLRKFDNYITPGGILCLVVPYYIFLNDENLCKMLTYRYNVMTIQKFREPEFSRFKQIVIVGEKKRENEQNHDMALKIFDYLSNIDTVYEIPLEAPAEKYKVPPSASSVIKYFEGTGVNIEDLKKVSANANILKFLVEKTTVKSNSVGKLGRPPLRPGKDHSYLLVVSGYGKGILGSEENQDVHLMRGNILNGEERHHEIDENGKVKETVRQFKKTVVTVIENSGKITTLG